MKNMISGHVCPLCSTMCNFHKESEFHEREGDWVEPTDLIAGHHANWTIECPKEHYTYAPFVQVKFLFLGKYRIMIDYQMNESYVYFKHKNDAELLFTFKRALTIMPEKDMINHIANLHILT